MHSSAQTFWRGFKLSHFTPCWTGLTRVPGSPMFSAEERKSWTCRPQKNRCAEYRLMISAPWPAAAVVI